MLLVSGPGNLAGTTVVENLECDQTHELWEQQMSVVT